VPTTITLQDIIDGIRNIPDYPKEGILFKDMSTVLQNPELYRATLDIMAERLAPVKPDVIAGVEARGFIFGAALADRLGVGFVPIRKKGKLPSDTVSYTYELEYGVDCIEMHKDAVKAGQRVVIVDDLLATGGTAAAASKLVNEVGGTIAGYHFMMELDFLNGRRLLEDAPVDALIHF
jgi:adenine phosphoribosyltransferase